MKSAGIGATKELKRVSSRIEGIELFSKPIKILGTHLSYHKQIEKQKHFKNFTVTKIIYLPLKNDSNYHRIKLNNKTKYLLGGVLIPKQNFCYRFGKRGLKNFDTLFKGVLSRF